MEIETKVKLLLSFRHLSHAEFEQMEITPQFTPFNFTYHACYYDTQILTYHFLFVCFQETGI